MKKRVGDALSGGLLAQEIDLVDHNFGNCRVCLGILRHAINYNDKYQYHHDCPNDDNQAVHNNNP